MVNKPFVYFARTPKLLLWDLNGPKGPNRSHDKCQTPQIRSVIVLSEIVSSKFKRVGRYPLRGGWCAITWGACANQPAILVASQRLPRASQWSLVGDKQQPRTRVSQTRSTFLQAARLSSLVAGCCVQFANQSQPLCRRKCRGAPSWMCSKRRCARPRRKWRSTRTSATSTRSGFTTRSCVARK